MNKDINKNKEQNNRVQFSLGVWNLKLYYNRLLHFVRNDEDEKKSVIAKSVATKQSFTVMSEILRQAQYDKQENATV